MTIAATRTGDDTFTVVGDQTDVFHTGRRVQLIGTASTTYGTILTATFSSVTTITLTSSSTTIAADLLSVLYGVVSAVEANSSMPIHDHDGGEGSGGEIDIAAANVNVADTNDYYVGTTTEAILDEIGETRLVSGFDLIDTATLPDLTFTDGTRTFDVAVQGGESDFSFWVNSKKFTKTSTQSTTIAAVTGTYYIYFDNAGAIQNVEVASLVPAVFYEYAIVGIVYWNNTAGAGFAGSEVHGKMMDGRTHHFNHATMGARYESGLDTTGLVADQATSTGTSSGFFWDEDIRHTIAAQATAPFIYRLGATGEWTTIAATNAIGHLVGGNTVWNEWTGATWQLTESAASTDFIIYFTIVSPDIGSYPVKKIIGQNGYPTRSAARAAIETELNAISLAGLPSPEFIFLSAYIVQRDGELEDLADGSTHIDLREIKGGTGTSSGTSSLAADVSVTTSSFDGILSVADTDVQRALDTIDDHTHAIAADSVNSTHIDWGTSANQVSQDDVVDGATYVRTHVDFTSTLSGNITTNNAKVGVTDEISNVVEDTTPQLGGDLDLNSNGMKLTGQTVGGANGDLVYLSAANTWAQADADAAATCSGMLGIRISATEVLTSGIYTTTGLTAASVYYASVTPGAPTLTAPTADGDIVRIVGYALSTTEFFFDPDKTFIELEVA